MAADGDIRVLLVLNLLLSAVFATVVVWGFAFLDMATFTPRTVAVGTLVIATLTYLVVLR